MQQIVYFAVNNLNLDDKNSKHFDAKSGNFFIVDEKSL